MSLAKLALACGLMVLVLAACGISAKPVAGTLHLDQTRGNHAKVDDPVRAHVDCLRADGLPFRQFRSSGNRPSIQIGALPGGPTVIFDSTPGGAQYTQMDGQVQGAEVIGGAFLYPNRASDAELKKIESCIAQGVKG
jgi:hypothetical protein